MHVRRGDGDAEADALRRVHVRTHLAVMLPVRLLHRLKDILALDDAISAQVGDQRRVRMPRRFPRHLFKLIAY